MINALTGFLVHVVFSIATLSVVASGFVWMFSPERAKEMLKRTAVAVLLAVFGLVMLNAYLHALSTRSLVAVGGLLAVSFTAYVVRLAKRSDSGRRLQRRLLGRE